MFLVKQNKINKLKENKDLIQNSDKALLRNHLVIFMVKILIVIEKLWNWLRKKATMDTARKKIKILLMKTLSVDKIYSRCLKS